MEICKIDIDKLKNFKLRNKEEDVSDVSEINVVIGGSSYTFSFYFFDMDDVESENKKQRKK